MQQLHEMEICKASQQEWSDGLQASLEFCRKSLAALENQLRESMNQVREIEAALVECKEYSKSFVEERAVLIVRIEEAEQQVFIPVYAPINTVFLLEIWFLCL